VVLVQELLDVLSVVVLGAGLDGPPLDAQGLVGLGVLDALVAVEVERFVGKLADVGDKADLPGLAAAGPAGGATGAAGAAGDTDQGDRDHDRHALDSAHALPPRCEP